MLSFPLTLELENIETLPKLFIVSIVTNKPLPESMLFYESYDAIVNEPEA